MPDSIDIDTQLLAHIDVTFWYITDYQKYTRTRHSPEPFFALYPMLLKRGGPVVSLAAPGVHITYFVNFLLRPRTIPTYYSLLASPFPPDLHEYFGGCKTPATSEDFVVSFSYYDRSNLIDSSRKLSLRNYSLKAK